MNRQFFTLMTVFLMLGTLWGKAQTATTPPEWPVGTAISTNQYYLLGEEGKGFLKADTKTFGSSTYTILSTELFNFESGYTPEKLDSSLWLIEFYEIDDVLIGYKFKNKATLNYLTLTNAEGFEYESAPGKSTFVWLPTKSYTNTEKMRIGLDGSYYLQIKEIVNGSTTTYSATTSTLATATNVHAYAMESENLTVTNINAQLGDGFQLMGKEANGGKATVKENELLDKKLTAISFYKDAALTLSTITTPELEQINNILGISNSNTLVTKADVKFSYFASSDFNDLLELQDATSSFYINITNSNYTKVLAAFKKASFVTIGSTKNYTEIGDLANSGKYNIYSKATGSSILSNKLVENAQFYVSYDPSEGSTEYPYNWLIIQANAKFGTGTSVIQKWVRPLLFNNGGENIVFTCPIEIPVTWQRITFTTGTGLVTLSEFGEHSYSITVHDKKDKNKLVTGYTLHPSGQTFGALNYASFEKTTNILQNKPEGLWKVLYSPDNGFVLYNRETGEKVNLGKTLHRVGTSDIYKIDGTIKGYRNYDSGAQDYTVYTVDTLQITRNNDVNGLQGYANGNSDARFNRVALQSTAYMLGIENAGFDTTVYIMNSQKHDNALMVNVKKNEGLYFYLIPKDTVYYGIKGIYNNDETRPIDNLKRIRYVLQEMTTKRYVVYDNSTGYNTFKLDDHEYCSSCSQAEKDKQALNGASLFYLKEKENKQYVIIYSTTELAKDANYEVNTANTKIGANIYTGLLYRASIYNTDNADKFGLYVESGAKYEDILKTFLGRNDTSLVKINLLSVQNAWGNSWSDKNCYMLLPGYHNFLMEGYPRPEIELKTRATLRDSLAMGGQLHDSIKFSIVVDTAYVRRAGVSMPMYYLGMSSLNPTENVQKGDLIGPLHPWDTDQYGHQILCTHYALSETSRGNFLFAMQDSIDHATGKDIVQEDYCYHYWLTHNPRLRFVHARHKVDTMIISSYNKTATPNYIKAGNVSLTTEVGYRQNEWLAPQLEGYAGTDGHPNYGLFAFETNPKPSNMYGRPEYALYNVASRKYVTYTNGNVILSDQPSWYIIDISNKDNGHFIVGNETVNASEVRVIAGSGKVTIQKAAGKQVVITNAIGKTLANTILTSDNAEVAVPQGIIFINVEGEKAATKVIIK